MRPTWVFSGNSSPEFSGCRWFEKKKSCEGSHSWEVEFCSFLECELFDFLKHVYWQSTWCSFLVLFTVGGFLLKPSPHKNSSRVITVNLLSCFANICFPYMLLIQCQLVICGRWLFTAFMFRITKRQESNPKSILCKVPFFEGITLKRQFPWCFTIWIWILVQPFISWMTLVQISWRLWTSVFQSMLPPNFKYLVCAVCKAFKVVPDLQQFLNKH